MSSTLDAQAVNLLNMKLLCERLSWALDRKEMSQSELARQVGVTRGAVSLWMKGGEMNAQNCAAVARALEIDAEWLATGKGGPDRAHRVAEQRSDALSVMPAGGGQEIPPGYIRLEHLSPAPSMGKGTLVSEPIQIVQYLDVLEQWVRQNVGSANPNRIKVLTGNGHSMEPTIKDHDLVFVDVECRTIDAAGIYVLDVAGRFILKKAMILSDSTLIIRSDNVAEYPDEERHDLRKAAETIVVCGKVLAWWTLRKG